MRKSVLFKLDPFIDEEGILRIGGRLKNATCLSEEEKHPIILPKGNHLTLLLVRYLHEKTFHQGKSITLAKIRSSGFWIIGCVTLVASVLSRCVVCRKLRYGGNMQKMSDLPTIRVEQSPPFTYIGCDCFGPFLVKEGQKEIKRYGFIAVCMATRAVHVEMLDDMTSDALINALRCIIAIRGPVHQIRSDRGSNLVGAHSELARELKSMSKSELANFLREQACEFITNPSHASHQGGCWERHIRTVRSVMNGICHQFQRPLNSSILRTFFYESMAIVNSRPLSLEDYNDIDGTVITPNHLLTMKSSVVAPPPGNFDSDDLCSRKRWRKVQALVDQFWKRWRIQYVQKLQGRQKWVRKKECIGIDDVVLVKDENVFRGQWKMGRVSEVKIGDDNLVRSATVVMSGKRQLQRPVQKLVLLFKKEDNRVEN